MSVKWVFFDVGYTLVNEEGAHRARFEGAAADIRSACGRDVSFEEFLALMDEGAGKRKKSPFNYALSRLGVTETYDYPCERESVYPEAAGVLSLLRPQYKLGIIANQTPELAGRLSEYGLLGYFDAVFGSDDVGFKKPDIEFYRHALSETGCSPDEAVMIGDRPDNDIAPAKKAGMKTIRIMSGYFKAFRAESGDETPDFTAASLSEIPGILAEI